MHDVYILIYTVYMQRKRRKFEDETMILLQDLSKKLDKFHLQDISLCIPKGYICGLVGENGAGKTTLLNLLLGLYMPDAGIIQIDGMGYEDYEEKIKDEIGVVLVDELFSRRLSLEDNAAYYGAYYSNFDMNYFKEHIKGYGLDSKAKFGRLSKGQKLKCQFAFALSTNPKLLILDEPTANFDSDFQDEFLEEIRDFIKDGDKSVVLATHLTDDLDKLADYLIYLEDGKQIYAGDIEAFRENYKLVEGERYKINLIKEEQIINIEETKYTTKALIKHRKNNKYDESLIVSSPSIEEFMYLYSKREGRR